MNIQKYFYLLIVDFQIGSLHHKSGIVLPCLQLLKEVDEGPVDQAVVLVHGGPADHLLQEVHHSTHVHSYQHIFGNRTPAVNNDLTR